MRLWTCQNSREQRKKKDGIRKRRRRKQIRCVPSKAVIRGKLNAFIHFEQVTAASTNSWGKYGIINETGSPLKYLRQYSGNSVCRVSLIWKVVLEEEIAHT